ncbi:hypothetical protein JCM8097_000758 [Rhodosporidiobolus ruineniae]
MYPPPPTAQGFYPPPPSAMYPYPNPYATSPHFPTSNLPLYGQNDPLLATHRPAFPAPPPPTVHAPFSSAPQPPHRSPSLGSPSLGLSPPVSAVRSDTYQAAHLSPGAVTSPPTPKAAAASGAEATPLPIKGDGDAMEYDEDEDDEDGEEEGGDWQEKAARGVAFLSLSANGNPTYIGPSSGFSWATFVLAGISGAATAEGGKYSTQGPQLETSQPLRQLTLPHHVLPDNALESIPDELADMVLSQTYRHVQPRYPFLDWLYVHEIWSHRIAITQRATQPNASKSLRTAAFFVWMMFAIGSRFCQKLSIPNLASPEAYYAKAMEHLEIIVGLHDLKNVQALCLMTMYSFRSSEAPSIWYLVGIMIRLCCSLGLHRKVPPIQAKRMSPYILQLRRRIFWSAYTLDRMMAMSLGRPASISDHDIDIELPLNFHCVSADFNLDNPPQGPTSMSSSIHFIKLMRIESIIQKQAYRVDKTSDEPPEPLLQLLDQWDAEIPDVAAEPNCWTIPCCTREWFLSRSADARMYLLRPRTADPATADPRFVKLIAKYAAEACEIQKRLHQNPESNLSLDGLRSIFLAGLTLLHACQIDRNALPLGTLQRAIRANSNTMFAYAGAYKGAAAYGEVFDELASAVLDKLTAPEETAPVPPPNLQSAAATPLFQSLWEDIPSVMTHNAQESFAALLESLGVSTDALLPPVMTDGSYTTTSGEGISGNGGGGSGFGGGAGGPGGGLDLSEIGVFAPASGLELEPFALGSSGGGLW